MTIAVALVDSHHKDSEVYSLHPDILLSIFDINANIHDESPLETARHTSQVCGSWRELMLSSSAIWGKLLKLAELQIDKDESPWRELVMGRTGSAPLYIKGEIPCPRVEWLLGFISPYWTRICNLDILPTGDEIVPVNLNTEFLNTPSDCIKSFCLPQVWFNPQAPWISNLRSISLSFPFTTTQILQCLSNMPCLEDAKLPAWFPDAPQSSDLDPDATATTDSVANQQIYLPHLTHLHLENFYTITADVLKRIAPNAQCSYTMFTFQDTITAPAKEIFSGYFQHQINLQAEYKLEVRVENKYVMVILGGLKAAQHTYLHNHSFDLSQVQEDDLLNYMSHFYLTGSEPTSGHGNVRELELDFNGSGPVYRDFILEIFPSIVHFILGFSSVTTLNVSQQSLFLLVEVYIDGQIANNLLFPSLKKLVFGYGKASDFPIEQTITKFLNQRRSCGRPITELFFGPNVGKLNIHWGFLEEFANMKVSFSLKLRSGTSVVGSYMCGSGEPEELNMTEGWEDRFNMGGL